MIKTSTKKNEGFQSLSEDVPDAKLEKSFYDSIKPSLNQLKRDPEAVTIEAILDYSRKLKK